MIPPLACPSSRRALHCIFTATRSNEVSLPTFLVPSLGQPRRRNFSTARQCRSKIGRAPLSTPPEVDLRVLEAPPARRPRAVSRANPSSTVEIEGPLGKMSMAIPPYVNIKSDEARRQHVVSITDTEDKKQKAMWGTVRAHLQNHILGVSEGHTAILRLSGVGYRASMVSNASTKKPEYDGQEFVSLKAGFSHPIELGVPFGVKASCPNPTRILLEGVEKEVVMQFAAEIREWRKPEPYKGKGIFVNDETIRLKAKKIK